MCCAHSCSSPLHVITRHTALQAVRNFVQLCLEGYYDNTIFHRIIKGFMMQGGDPSGTGEGGASAAAAERVHAAAGDLPAHMCSCCGCCCSNVAMLAGQSGCDAVGVMQWEWHLGLASSRAMCAAHACGGALLAEAGWLGMCCMLVLPWLQQSMNGSVPVPVA